MLYFMQAGNRIKIGKGLVASRLRNAKTWSPEKVQLLLAIHVWNEDEAERKLHHHFRDHRLNGEWFEINFPTAFRALLELKIVPDVEQPLLELPVMPPIHPEFRRWFLGVDWRIIGSNPNPYGQSPDELNRNPEHIRWVDDNLEALWAKHFRLFENGLKAHSGDVEAMIAGAQQISLSENQSLFSDLRELLKGKIEE